MKFTVMTLFPEMVSTILNESIIGRAKEKGIIEIDIKNIRDYSLDKHRRVDDYPYGGGPGMVMACQPIYDCWKAILADNPDFQKTLTVYMSPQGPTFSQRKAIELTKYDHIILLCGHYEGVDERVLEEIVDEEISIGNYVVTGGELPACIVVDSVSRMIDGVLSETASYECESHFGGLLEHPQYTRPEEWRGKKVPDVLLSGHHKNIEIWQKETAKERTKVKRPDLLKKEL